VCVFINGVWAIYLFPVFDENDLAEAWGQKGVEREMYVCYWFESREKPKWDNKMTIVGADDTSLGWNDSQWAKVLKVCCRVYFNLSVESNQNVESKTKNVESRLKNVESKIAFLLQEISYFEP